MSRITNSRVSQTRGQFGVDIGERKCWTWSVYLSKPLEALKVYWRRSCHPFFRARARAWNSAREQLMLDGLHVVYGPSFVTLLSLMLLWSLRRFSSGPLPPCRICPSSLLNYGLPNSRAGTIFSASASKRRSPRSASSSGSTLIQPILTPSRSTKLCSSQ